MPATRDFPPLTLTTSEPRARALRRDHALAQKRAGHAAWEVPPIHGLRRWCREQWLQTWPSAQLLHGVQELALWQQVIEADGASRQVLGPALLARQARTAMHLALQYSINPDTSPRFTDEQQAFARWYREVRAQLAQRDWVCEAELPLHTAELIRNGALQAPQQVLISGSWPPLTPAETLLLDAMRAAGSSIRVEPSPQQQTQLQAWACPDDSAQFRLLAAQLRALLLPFTDSDELPPRIIVACPDIDARRDLLEATLRPVLAPWLSAPGDTVRAAPWRIAGGRPLHQQPLVAVALAVCGLRPHDNRMDELSRVLLASVLWTWDERRACAAADYALRRRGGTRFSLPALLDALEGEPETLFHGLLSVVSQTPHRQLPSGWVSQFEARLAALGWPGKRSLPSPDFQAQQRWLESLATLSAMDNQLGPVTHAESLTWLREILSSQSFEPRADSLQPVEILPLDQAAGLPADHLFIIDACDDVIPGPSLQQAFLARETLIAAGVPGATPASALAQAQQMAAVLGRAAGMLTLSYARSDERGAKKTPTALFGSDLNWQPAENPQPLTQAEHTCHMGPLTFIPTSDPVPPVQDAAAEGVFGGVAIFRDFVEAPFFAYCKYRLGIEPLPEPGAGLEATAQGSVIHAVLEAAWRKLRTQVELKQLDDKALGALLDVPLDQAMTEHMPAERYGRRLRALERARLRDVLLQWLRHDQRREEPFEVIGFEHEVPLRFEGLDLKLRIDRVDQVDTVGGERLLILDYKTGRNAELGGWETDKFKEPQLPLYATGAALGILGISRVDGIAFAHVRDGHPALVAATNWRLRLLEHERFKHIENWEAQLSAWQARLTAITRAFLAGEAGIDPDENFERSFNAPLLDLLRGL